MAGYTLGEEALEQIRAMWEKWKAELGNPDAGHRGKTPANESETLQGFLAGDLAAATNSETGETTALLDVWYRSPSTGNLTDANRQITVTNRYTDFAAANDNYLVVTWIEGEWRPVPDESAVVHLAKANVNVAGLSTAGNASSGAFTLYDLSSTGGITSASTTVTAWNIEQGAITATSSGFSTYYLLHRHFRSGRWIIDPPPHVVEIGRADSDISAATTAGVAGSGTVSIYTFTTDNTLTDTTIDVTAYNLSRDAVTAGKILQLVRHYRTGKWLVNFEDCASGTT